MLRGIFEHPCDASSRSSDRIRRPTSDFFFQIFFVCVLFIFFKEHFYLLFSVRLRGNDQPEMTGKLFIIEFTVHRLHFNEVQRG